MRGATRQINSPFLLREDVGVLGVLSGDWGSSSRGLQGQEDIDLRSAPVAVLMLQESHPELVEALGQGPSDGAPGWDSTAPAMAGWAGRRVGCACAVQKSATASWWPAGPRWRRS